MGSKTTPTVTDIKLRPADLREGMQLQTDNRCGGRVVMDADPVLDVEGDEPDRVYVQVRVTPTLAFDPDDLPSATGAEWFAFLSLNPLRYRLAFRTDASVAIMSTDRPEPMPFSLCGCRTVEQHRMILAAMAEHAGDDPTEPAASHAQDELIEAIRILRRVYPVPNRMERSHLVAALDSLYEAVEKIPA